MAKKIILAIAAMLFIVVTVFAVITFDNGDFMKYKTIIGIAIAADITTIAIAGISIIKENTNNI